MFFCVRKGGRFGNLGVFLAEIRGFWMLSGVFLDVLLGGLG